LQKFTEVAGKPWYALQKHSAGRVERQWTGFYGPMMALARDYKAEPRALPPVAEEEFLARFRESAGVGLKKPM
jgi:hypothetical protein